MGQTRPHIEPNIALKLKASVILALFAFSSNHVITESLLKYTPPLIMGRFLSKLPNSRKTGAISDDNPRPVLDANHLLKQPGVGGIPGLGFEPFRDVSNLITHSEAVLCKAYNLSTLQPRARDDSFPFPLDGVELASVSDTELLRLFSVAPKLYDCGGGATTVRLSKSLLLKGGEGAAVAEARNLAFAADVLHLAVPKVYHAFKAQLPLELGPGTAEGSFFVMEYIPGPTIEEIWDTLDKKQQESVADQVAAMIEAMQKMPLDLPPGPIGGSEGRRFQGPWFTDDGAGPFATLQSLEDWYNHKVDICIKFKQLPKRAPRFKFRGLVFSHQDIAPRNLILDKQGHVWLVDWAWAGVYPPGFEQAALITQSRGGFREMVMERLSDRQEELAKFLASISYGLSVAARL